MAEDELSESERKEKDAKKEGHVVEERHTSGGPDPQIPGQTEEDKVARKMLESQYGITPVRDMENIVRREMDLLNEDEIQVELARRLEIQKKEKEERERADDRKRMADEIEKEFEERARQRDERRRTEAESQRKSAPGGI